jgi:hypothetical protein
VEASLARKKKKAKKAKRRQEKEMEIACRVWMSEDRNIIQGQYEFELSTDSDDGDCFEEEESEFGNIDWIVVKPHGTVVSEIPEGFEMSSSAPEARKRVAEDDVAPTEEEKWARVEKRLGALQMPSPLASGMEWHEDELGSAPVWRRA